MHRRRSQIGVTLHRRCNTVRRFSFFSPTNVSPVRLNVWISLRTALAWPFCERQQARSAVRRNHDWDEMRER